MHTMIITGGSIDDNFAEQYLKDHPYDLLIAADHGLDFCRRTGLIPDLILGDFDSASKDTLAAYQEKFADRIEVFPAHKDETDTELAILRALRMEATQITVLGATGTRLDHVLGNLQLLKMTLDLNIDCCLVDPHNRIRMIHDRLVLKKEEQFGRYVSLIPFTERVEGLTLKGFVYDVTDFTLESGKARGVSNELAGDRAEIELGKGVLFVIESRD